MESITLVSLFSGIVGASVMILGVILMMLMVVKCSEWCFRVELDPSHKLILRDIHVQAIFGSRKLTQKDAVAKSYPVGV